MEEHWDEESGHAGVGKLEGRQRRQFFFGRTLDWGTVA